MAQKRPLSKSESQLLSFLSERCPGDQVAAVLGYDPEVLLKTLTELIENQWRFIFMKH